MPVRSRPAAVRSGSGGPRCETASMPAADPAARPGGSGPASPTALERGLAVCGIVGVVGFVGAWAIAAQFVEGYSGIDDAISRLASSRTRPGPSGWMTTGSVAFGVGGALVRPSPANDPGGVGVDRRHGDRHRHPGRRVHTARSVQHRTLRVHDHRVRLRSRPRRCSRAGRSAIEETSARPAGRSPAGSPRPCCSRRR